MLVDTMCGARAYYLGELFDEAARRHPDTTVVFDHDLRLLGPRSRSFTVVELAREVETCSARLWAAGIRPTEQVVVQHGPTADTIVLVCALARIGAVPAPVSPALPAETVARIASRFSRPWVVCDREDIRDAVDSDKAAGILTLGLDSGSSSPVRPLEAIAPVQTRPIRLARREPALISHSSGTTGVPKLAVHCAEALWYRIMPQRIFALPAAGREKAALCMSFVHSRFYHSLATFLYYGNDVVILAKSDPEHVADVLAATRPGVLETPPNNFLLWEGFAAREDGPFASVRYFGSTFDAIHPRTVQALLAASDRSRPKVYQLYGQSETGPLTITAQSADSADSRCVGRPVPGFIRARVVDERHKRLPSGRVGAIEVRTNGLALTYLGEEDRYAANLHDGWWGMGDMGHFDRLGRLHLVDREVDQVEEVQSSLHVEDVVLDRLGELIEVVIVRSPEGRAQPIVCTRGDLPLNRERWAAATRDQGSLNDPLHWRFRDLPRTATLKVQRLAVADLIARDEHRSFLVQEEATGRA